jgi:hypothetical protein
MPTRIVWSTKWMVWAGIPLFPVACSTTKGVTGSVPDFQLRPRLRQRLL